MIWLGGLLDLVVEPLCELAQERDRPGCHQVALYGTRDRMKALRIQERLSLNVCSRSHPFVRGSIAGARYHGSRLANAPAASARLTPGLGAGRAQSSVCTGTS